MVDTRTRNNSNTPCGSLSNTSISTLEQSGCQETTMLEDLPVSIWQSGPHPPQIPVVSVKQEPMDTEHDSHSPNNDSGISPDHGSSGSSSTGRPSPGQRGTFGSPEYFSVQESQGMRSEPNVESSTSSSQFQNNQHHITQNIPPIWEISLLALGGPGNPVLDHSLLKHTSETSEPDHPHQQPSRSPSSRNHITQNRTPTTSPLHCLKSFVTPIANRSHIVNHNTVCPVKTSPISTTNASSVLNTSLSDDNNSMSSSSSSSTMVLDGRDENFKMTLPEEQQNPLRSLETAVEQSSIMGGKRVHGFAPGAGATNNGVRNIYQCPLCDYSTLSRADFNEHNKTHCPDQKCSKCDFVTKDIAELETHLSEHHMISPGIIQQIVEANEEQAGIRVPRVNSQGKVKTFRCKQCNFVAVTKTEFWNHSRQHIKKDKMLTCPRCPFVTEYKHHLEYHLRNHANSKPYECPHCSYICVNKSMLNSHLKSHSNVCQYRCATCKYETKYLHSLKVHLRKYEHSPAIVLNPDGTPNPDPIIDVYGTRRGPKQRPRNTMKSTSKENNNDIPFPYHAPPPVPIFQPSYQVIPQQPRKHPVAYPYGCIMPNAFIANNNSNSLLPKFPQPGVICTREQNTDVPDLKRNLPNENSENFLATAFQYDHMSSTNNSNKNNASGSNDLKMIDPEQSAEEQNSDKRNKLGTREEVMSCNSKEVEGDPLDLRKPDAMNVSSEASVSYVTPSILHKSTSMKTSKHRRKGQAYKLEQISWKLQQSNLSENGGVNRSYSHVSESEKKSPSERTDNLINTQHAEDNDIHGKQHSKQHSQSELMEVNEDLPKTEEESSSTHANNSASRDNPEVHHCAHCDIIFNDFLLYSMHKGYHGFQDPFTCNMCGVPTANKVDFFLHIARSSHS